MTNEVDASTKSDGIKSEELVRSGLEDKVRAISGYEEIIWKIRSGYIVLLYGALTFVLGKDAIPNICAIPQDFSHALAIFSLIVGLSLSVSLIDSGYVRKRLKVVVARDKLIELACMSNFDIKKEGKEVQRLLHVAGETNPKKLPYGLISEYKEKLQWNIVSILLPIYITTPALALLMYVLCRLKN